MIVGLPAESSVFGMLFPLGYLLRSFNNVYKAAQRRDGSKQKQRMMQIWGWEQDDETFFYELDEPNEENRRAKGDLELRTVEDLAHSTSESAEPWWSGGVRHQGNFHYEATSDWRGDRPEAPKLLNQNQTIRGMNSQSATPRNG